MAEAVLFSVADGIIWNLGSLALKEIGFLWGVKDELLKLHDTISAIKALLLDAEEKRADNHQVRDWLEKLQDVVYDADDLVDEFQTEDLRRRVMMPRRKMARKVRIIFSSSKQLAFRLKMDRKVKEVREALDEIRACRPFYLMERLEEVQVSTRVRESYSFVREEEVIGRENDREKIKQILMDFEFEENIAVIPIVGMGGLGKTTIAQLVFNDDKVQKHFELKMWVCVSDVSDFRLIIEKIIKAVTGKGVESLDIDQLQNRLRREINRKRYFLVLDDVWNENREEWLSLKSLLLGGAAGSRVLITTRSEKVAKTTQPSQWYRLRSLDKDKSWSLFKRMAFERGEEPENANIVTMGMDIVEKCKGVPLAIRTVGSILYFKSLESEWLFFTNNELVKIAQRENNILATLELSYNHLPVHLKHCFAYCRLFPKDHEIDVQMLIKLWIAQGFIKPLDESQCLEDVGYGYFLELLWRSFFQEAKKDKWGNIRSCKMHDFMHDLAIKVAGMGCVIVDENVENVHGKTRHVSFDFEFDLLCRIPASMLEQNKIRTFLSPSRRTRQFFFLGEERLRWSNCNEILSSFKLLRMLDLKNLRIETLPNSLGKLKHLRYLDLSYNKFTLLPSSITRLHNLQTLILSGCSELLRLPREMKNLVNLRHLVMKDCWSLTHMPCGLGGLTSLHTLDQFVVDENNLGRTHSGRIDELGNLNNLRGELAIINLGHGKDMALESRATNLKEKRHLQRLLLEWKYEDYNGKADILEIDEMALDGLQPHSNLKILEVREYMGVRFARWLSSLINVVELDLNFCENCQHLPPLDRLPSLKKLRLCRLTALEYVSDVDMDKENEFCTLSSTLIVQLFPSLLKLEIRDCPNLKGWWRIRGDIDEKDKIVGSMTKDQKQPLFSCLSDLTIHNCSNLTSMPLFPYVEGVHLTNTSFKPLQQTMTMMIGSMEATTSSSSASTAMTYTSPPPLSKLKFLLISEIEDVESLPDGIGNLSSLQSLHILHCPNFTSLPERIGILPSLRSVQIWGCPNLTSLPEGLSNLSSLTCLRISNCPNLASLPVGMPCLTSLELLKIENCPVLVQRYKCEDWPQICHIPRVRLF